MENFINRIFPFDYMVNAIVLAGGNKRFSPREFWSQLEDLFYYHEIYLRRTYKAVRHLKWKLDGVDAKRPMIEYTLSTLQNMPEIEKVVAIGPKKEIEDSLEYKLRIYDKCEIIEQTDSFGGNVKKAYGVAGNKPTLIITADSPTTKEDSIREFLGICDKLKNNYQFIYPIVSERVLKPYEKFFPRPYLRILLDNIYPKEYAKKKEEKIRRSFFKYIFDFFFPEDKREGVRITSMAWADLNKVSEEKIDEAYSLRKALKKSTRDKIRKIFGEHVFREYFRRELKLSKIEQLVSEYFNLNTKIVGLSKGDSSLDVDSTRDEVNMRKLISLL